MNQSGLYVHKVDGKWVTVVRPQWFNEDMTPASDALLAAQEDAHYPLDGLHPTGVNTITHVCVAMDQEHWILRDGVVYIKHEIQPLPLSIAKENAIKYINSEFDNIVHHHTYMYPEHERMTWDMQQTEATQWHQDPSTPTPLLDSIAKARFLDLDEFRNKTYNHVRVFNDQIGHFIGQRHWYRDLIEDATSLVQIVDILSICFYDYPDVSE